jgi:hypothetical protein
VESAVVILLVSLLRYHRTHDFVRAYSHYGRIYAIDDGGSLGAQLSDRFPHP